MNEITKTRALLGMPFPEEGNMNTNPTKVVYACTHVEKTTEADDHEDGCDPKTHFTNLDEPCNIVADTLSGLLRSLGERYGLTIDDVFLPDDGESGWITYFGYDRHETTHGEEPTDQQIDRWKCGEETLYHAVYTFWVERREVRPVRATEFTDMGIHTH